MPTGGAQGGNPAARARVAGRVARSLIHKVKPQLSRAGPSGPHSGTVVLQAVISKDGTIENLRVVSGHPMLAHAAMEAVKQWRTSPTS